MQPTLARWIYNAVTLKIAAMGLQSKWPDLFTPGPQQRTQIGPPPPPGAVSADGPPSAPPRGAPAAPRARTDVTSGGTPGEPAAGAAGGGAEDKRDDGSGGDSGGEGSSDGWWDGRLLRHAYSVAENTRLNYQTLSRREDARHLQRGQLMLRGMLEVRCETGYALLDVSAPYDPAADTITFIWITVRSIHPYVQRPRR
jgi:hypothetical protein